MGIAAYNRGSRAISQRIDSQQRAAEFELMSHLNSLPKYPDCGQPPAQIQFVFEHGVWWAQSSKGAAGFAYYYPTLREAVRRWNVSIRGYADGIWIGDPLPREVQS